MTPADEPTEQITRYEPVSAGHLKQLNLRHTAARRAVIKNPHR